MPGSTTRMGDNSRYARSAPLDKSFLEHAFTRLGHRALLVCHGVMATTKSSRPFSSCHPQTRNLTHRSLIFKRHLPMPDKG